VTDQHYEVLIKILRDFGPDNTIHEIHEAEKFCSCDFVDRSSSRWKESTKPIWANPHLPFPFPLG